MKPKRKVMLTLKNVTTDKNAAKVIFKCPITGYTEKYGWRDAIHSEKTVEVKFFVGSDLEKLLIEKGILCE